MRFATAGGVRLHYALSGTEAAWLVLLHEIGGSLQSWTPVAEELGKRFRVLRYDQRGAGKSEKITGPFSIDSHIDDLADLLDELGAPRACHIAGVAIGAALAVRYATRFPARVTSLVLACPAPGVSPDRMRYLEERAAQVERDGMAATADSSLGNSWPPEVVRDGAAYDAYRGRFLANDPKSYAAINRAFGAFDVTSELSRVGCPTLVLAGRHDRLRPPAFVREVAAKIPGARYGEIDSGHIMPVQAPAALLAAMTAFYAAISSG
jgi:3-oxoadipate enol-lactonase